MIPSKLILGTCMILICALPLQALPRLGKKMLTKDEKVTTGVPVTIIGSVDAYDYDDNDQPKSFKLLAEIEIENTEEARKLIKCLDQYVKVTGRLSVSGQSQKLRITHLDKVYKDPDFQYGADESTEKKAEKPVEKKDKPVKAQPKKQTQSEDSDSDSEPDTAQ